MKKTDLAVESAQLAAGMPGIRTVNRTIGGVKITDITIPEGISATRPAGRYITLEGDPAAPQLAALLSRAIGRLLPPEGLILAAGLGNPDITRDSLGAFTIRKLVPLTGNRYSLAAMETDVSARTGIETVRMLRAVAAEMNAACIFAVDSLCCRDPFRMCRTVQLSTGGITPRLWGGAFPAGAFPENRRCPRGRLRSADSNARQLHHWGESTQPFPCCTA